ncbi:hypothetical protein [Nocardioides sp. Leaf285]|nr:hypothetical protein [Nocardioides sp. Leaf285]
MIRLEIHPGEGGADAEAFASELGTAITKHSGTSATHEGRVVAFHRL